MINYNFEWDTDKARSNTGRLVVVCHTFQKEEESNVAIRLFSSRKANKKETKQYKD